MRGRLSLRSGAELGAQHRVEDVGEEVGIGVGVDDVGVGVCDRLHEAET